MAERKIGRDTFQTQPLAARDALKLWYRILKAFGPAVEKLPEIFKGLTSTDAAAKLAANNTAVAALVTVMQGLDEETMISLVDDILRAGTIKRDSGTWDEISLDLDFRDGLANVFPVVGFIVGEQFSELFRGLPASGRPKTV